MFISVVATEMLQYIINGYCWNSCSRFMPFFALPMQEINSVISRVEKCIFCWELVPIGNGI